jgi:serine/threonine protein phosphatase 1
MSKWRPSSDCIYVFGDIHGHVCCLNTILKRILPLRPNDKIVFLGDYIDRGPDSFAVIEKLISLSEKYKDQVTCLMGNHEWLLLSSLGLIDNKVPHLVSNDLHMNRYSTVIWLKNGGVDTMKSYARKNGIENQIPVFTIAKMLNITPQTHIDFMLNLKLHHTIDDYKFIHAGCDPSIPIEDNSSEDLLWDRQLFDFVKKCVVQRKKFSWDGTIVCGHNYDGPIITDSYIMADTSAKKKLLCLELNSKTGYYATPGQARLVKM